MHRKPSEYLSFRDLIKMSVGDRVGGGSESRRERVGEERVK